MRAAGRVRDETQTPHLANRLREMSTCGDEMPAIGGTWDFFEDAVESLNEDPEMIYLLIGAHNGCRGDCLEGRAFSIEQIEFLRTRVNSYCDQLIEELESAEGWEGDEEE